MHEYLFVFQSLTKAQKAITLLRNHGIVASLVHAPELAQRSGCGYGIKVKGAAGHQSAAILRAADVRYDRVFFSKQDGRAEENGL